MLTRPINSQHYAKLKKESGTLADGTDEINGADDAAGANNNSDADSNSDPALASNVKSLQKQPAKRKRAPKDPSKAPPAKRGKKNTAATDADADAEPESSKPRARGRARKAATATKTKVNDDEAMMGSDNANEIDVEGGAIKEEEEEEDADAAPAPVLVKETKPKATRARKPTANPKPKATRAKKPTILANDSEDEPDAEIAEEELPESRMLAAYTTRSRPRTVVGGFRGGERKAAYEKEKMGEMEEQQELLENINVGFADGEEEGDGVEV